jgi:hypothetical protein
MHADEPPSKQRFTVKEAAKRLNVSEAASRQRIQREPISYEKDEETNRVYILLHGEEDREQKASMYQSRPPERCDHRGAYFTNLVTRTERGYRARCPQCGASGPVRPSTKAARRALVTSGREAQGR